MRLLVTYATKHGATEGIARRIGAVLRSRGQRVDVRRVERVTDIAGYDAFVVGSAVYYGRWLAPARAFVRANAALLTERPTWLFSSGPVAGKPTTPARELDEFGALVRPAGRRVFEGALTQAELTFADRAVIRMVGAPYGDYRDWAAIEAWAADIADRLTPAPATRQRRPAAASRRSP